MTSNFDGRVIAILFLFVESVTKFLRNSSFLSQNAISSLRARICEANSKVWPILVGAVVRTGLPGWCTRTRNSIPFSPQMAVPRLQLRIGVVQFNPKVRESQTSSPSNNTLSNDRKF